MRLSAIFIFWLLASLMTSLSWADASERPNFVIILADDLGYGDLGCYGQKRIRTPNIDGMAREGMRFTDFYVASSICTPSRAALMTGCYSQRVGMSVLERKRDGELIPWYVMYPGSRQGLHADEVTLPEQLKKQGYATGCVGKWHLGDQPEFMPNAQGFDYYYGIPYSNDMKPSVIVRNEDVVDKNPEQETLVERFTEAAVKYISENKDKPFFLYLAHTAPHTPLHASERFRGKSEGGIYGDVVESLDWSTGEVLNTLKKLGIEKKTCVVFLSDNGPWLLRGEKGGIATPLRNGKGSSYEGGFRVPCIMQWPGVIPANTVCSEMATAMDLFPTFGKLAGIDGEGSRRIDGKDISALMRGEPGAESPHKAFYYYFMNELQAVRSGPWKLKLETVVGRDDHYTHVGDPQSSVPTALYNLQADPGEQKSVYKDHPKIVERLESLAEQMRQDLGDSIKGIPGANRRPAGFVEQARTIIDVPTNATVTTGTRMKIH